MRPPSLIALLLALTVSLAPALPPDFEQTLFVSGLKDPATMAFAPDGRLFVGERIVGKIRIVTQGGQLLPTPFLTLDVPPERHRSGGVRGFAFDPDFPAAPYVYVFYTKQFPDGKRHNRVSRFTVSATDPNLADAASEVVLLELPFNNSSTGSSGSHNGGAVVFGGDGKLYATTGDGWQNSNGYFAGDNVQSLATLTGKVFRINKDGSIPTDNPFYAQTTGDHRAIYALGLRNPYAATVHPVTGEVFVFDVGTANGGNKDHIFRVVPADNYGHDGDSGIGNRVGTWAKIGTQIASGGVWYFADQFPATYHGRLFTSAWKQGLKTVTSESNATIADFASADVPNQGPLYPSVGPDGSLYYLHSTYETGNGEIYRIRYTLANTASQPTIAPNGGNFIDDVTVTLATSSPGTEIRYTTDGSTPTAASTLYPAPLTLTQSLTLSAKTFGGGFDPSSVSTAAFTVTPSSPPSIASTPNTAANVSSSYTHTITADATPAATFSLDTSPAGMSINASTGQISWTPSTPGDFPVTVRASNAVAPDDTQSFTITVTNFRLADTPDLAALTNGTHQSGNTHTGYLNIPADGEYAFVLNGTDTLAIGSADTSSGPIGLQAGLHIFTFTSNLGVLAIRWSSPSFAEEDIPAANYFRYIQPYGIFASTPAPAYLGFPPDETDALPPTLSATSAFSDVAALIAAPGLVPYTMNSPLYSDNAGKLRWISVPADAAITFDPTGEWSFPPGTVLVKHFELGDERRRLETRFEIIREDGTPYFLTYQWRADQSEADLLPAAGASALINYDTDKTQTWHFPSRNDCLACHNSSIDHVLGPSTRQLNGDYLYPDSGTTDNQLRTWSHLGLFANPPADPPSLDALSAVDSSEPIEHRVRSYLDANCAFCHNPAGSPEGTGFVLDYSTTLEQSGLIDGTAANDLGLGALARIIAPQDPLHSVLLARVTSNDPLVRMPPIGRDIVHPEARDAILEWLLTLPPANTSSDIAGWTKRWTFDDQIDSGTWRDTVNSPTYRTGQNAGALEFDGSDDSVDLGPLDVPGDQLTIALWFKADDFGTSDARFLSKADGQFDQDHYWMLSTLNSTRLRLRLRTNGNTTTLSSDTGTLAAGVWTHVAAVYDGATMKLYKNGNEVASVAKTGVLDTSGTVDAAIGNQPLTASGGSRPFDGLIDDLRIYDRALTPAELVTIQNAAQQTNTAPSIASTPPATAVGDFITRANLIDLTATASDPEDGALTSTWYSNLIGAFDPAASLPDGLHQIVATARDANGSAISTSYALNIVPGFAGWAADNGLAATPLANPDGDTHVLLEEYAHLLSPSASDPEIIAPSFIELAPDQHALAITFPARNDAIDLTYTVQLTSDLSTPWTDAASFSPIGTSVARDSSTASTSVDLVSDGEGSMIIERDTVIVELPDNARRFMRVEISAP